MKQPILTIVQSQMKVFMMLTYHWRRSITYFSGYLAKKCFDKFNCANCNLIKPNEHLADKKELLIIHKVFDRVQQSQSLKAPSDELTQIVTICSIY